MTCLPWSDTLTTGLPQPLHDVGVTDVDASRRDASDAQQASPPYKKTCNICGLICRSRKGLRVHLHSKHRQPVHKRERDCDSLQQVEASEHPDANAQ
ncbi:hypothetical protein TNIN_263101 [Trichonephila inaurata madagascariensis]|uniref:C2H2-type domain-containing protein n=1 Tax=Trichonephila inaurata madagascariensis TaxID=2747483 RepID=A0A8X6Y9M7_9ARAC|nr:hypothetical protein TNIN_263101 [Trichonephila inaurata madagascariensis]